MYRYTFIIPHKDSKNLLYRCINSIPARDDIQIIVIDDNSSDKNFDLILFKKHNVDLVLLPASKTSGGARNVGLEKAKGKWILFADADDYYVNDFISILDEYCDLSSDLVFFDVDDSEQTLYKLSNLHPYLRNNLTREEENILKYKNTQVWSKMFKREFLIKYGFKFEETRNGNDILFAISTSYFCQSYSVIPLKVYVYCLNNLSISNKRKNISESMVFLTNSIKLNQFFNYIGLKPFTNSITRIILSLTKKYGPVYIIILLLKMIINGNSIFKKRNAYVNYISKIGSISKGLSDK